MAHSKVEAALAALRTEAQRLAPDQGRIARRNARRAVLGAMRQVRNALNIEFPRMEKAPPPSEEKAFVIEVFERAHREGGRFYNERWAALRRDNFLGRYSFKGSLPNRLFDKKGKSRAFPFAKAAKYAKRLKDKYVNLTWRLREVGADNVVMADIL
jgi:hypothetical protein